ncbi:VOC family protein [Nocardioides anomalus]|uniref:VOC family protein n=1 Tax=Nocardioides anomalus TaxID=2712223 RepID=A0A6G6WHC7_9ACTN|nr:VOC family protein [Nocardioides anomalus]QIG44495.1 VOC family protein [Nocardioides anomalus]
MRLDLTTLVVDDQDEAIAFFVDALGFELAEDRASTTDDGRAKRWVVVRPPGGGAGLLLARADGPEQEAAVGRQTGGRVGFFLHVEAFAPQHARMLAAGVEFLEEPRHEAYGTVAVFLDCAGNRWDLLGG